jgi:hypothetical protein
MFDSHSKHADQNYFNGCQVAWQSDFLTSIRQCPGNPYSRLENETYQKVPSSVCLGSSARYSAVRTFSLNSFRADSVALAGSLHGPDASAPLRLCPHPTATDAIQMMRKSRGMVCRTYRSAADDIITAAAGPWLSHDGQNGNLCGFAALAIEPTRERDSGRFVSGISSARQRFVSRRGLSGGTPHPTGGGTVALAPPHSTCRCCETSSPPRLRRPWFRSAPANHPRRGTRPCENTSAPRPTCHPPLCNTSAPRPTCHLPL